MATDHAKSFVFYDPTGKRWARIRRVLQTAGLIFAVGLAILFLVVITGPQLPALGLPAVAPLVQFGEVPVIIRGERAQKNVPFRMSKPAKPVRYVRSASPVPHPKPAAKAGEGRPLRRTQAIRLLRR